MKRFKLAFTFGRFNLLHRGHLDLFKRMAEDAEEIVIGVSSGSKNLNYSSRRRVIRLALNEDPDFKTPYTIVAASSPFGLLDHVCADPEDTTIYLGNDQFELGQTMAREFGCSAVTIPRLTSSTTIRHLIDTNQWSLLANEVPFSIINDVIFLRQQELSYA